MQSNVARPLLFSARQHNELSWSVITLTVTVHYTVDRIVEQTPSLLSHRTNILTYKKIFNIFALLTIDTKQNYVWLIAFMVPI